MKEKMNKIPYVKSMRLQQNYHALNRSYDNLFEAMTNANNLSENKNNVEKFQEIYIGINELLLWVITTDEWFINNGKIDYTDRKKASPKGQQILGLRYVFNRFKHNMNSINLYSTGFFGQSINSEDIKWLPVIERNKKFRRQFKCYKKYTKDNNVMKSFTDAVEFLRDEFQRTQF